MNRSVLLRWAPFLVLGVAAGLWVVVLVRGFRSQSGEPVEPMHTVVALPGVVGGSGFSDDGEQDWDTDSEAETRMGGSPMGGGGVARRARARMEQTAREAGDLAAQVEISPDDPNLLRRAADQLYEGARFAEAAAHLEAAARLDPQARDDQAPGERWLRAAECWLRAGSSDRAWTCALEAARGDPTPLARWYLRVAGDRTGRDPEALPPELRFAREIASPPPGLAFRDVAPELGVARVGLGRGVAMEDIDGDGRYDLVASALDLPLTVWRNTTPPGGPLSFQDVTRDWGLGQQDTEPWGVILVDYDGDGDLDLFAPAYDGPYRLYRWEAERFREVSAEAGLDPRSEPGAGDRRRGWCATWLDYDGDGDLDLFAPNMSWEQEAVPACGLYRNDGDGRFTEVAAEAGAAVADVIFSASAADYDGDGDTDLYLNANRSWNHFLRNEGGGRFADVGFDVGVWNPVSGFVCFFEDFDHDGLPDVFASGNLTGIEEVLDAWEAGEYPGPFSQRLYLNRGDGRFRDATEEAGLLSACGTMGGLAGDFDGDGRLDLYLGNGGPAMHRLEPNALWWNRAEGPWVDIAPALGLDHLGKGHGMAAGDLDRDGDLDLYHGLGGAEPNDVFPNALYVNESTAGHHWLTLHLRQPGPNTRAVGAKVLLRAGDLRLYRHVQAGEGFGSTSTYAQEMGLGPRARIDELLVTWPDGEETRLDAPPVDCEITLERGQPWRLGAPR